MRRWSCLSALVLLVWAEMSAVSPLLASEPGLAPIHRLTGGGVTPEVNPTQEQMAALVPLHTYRLRLINVDRNIVKVTPEGGPQVMWSPNLKWGLEQCKTHSWVPRLIIGQWVPEPLALHDTTGRKYGPTSWVIYERYLLQFFQFVTIDSGFAQSEWEVGNEMDVSSENWVAAKAYPVAGQEGLGPYLELYRHVNHAMMEFQRANPGVTMRLGGPAVTVNALRRYGNFNWMDSFVDAVAKEHLKCDFISLHIYGNEISATGLTQALDGIREHARQLGLVVPFSISEWGPTDTNYAPLADTPIAGSFVAEFLTTLEASGISDAIFLAQRGGVGSSSLFTMSNQPTDSYKALLLLGSLKGRRVPCQTGYSDMKCLAAQPSPGSFEVVLWRLDWSLRSLAPAEIGIHNGQETMGFRITAGLAPGTKVNGSRVEINGNALTGPSGAVNAVAGSDGVLTAASQVSLRYGDYAGISLHAR